MKSQIPHQSGHEIVSDDQSFIVDHRQGKPRALQQRTEFAHVGKWSNVRSNFTFDLDLRGRDGLAKLRQTLASDQGGQQQTIRLQRAANLDQGPRQVVDKL